MSELLQSWPPAGYVYSNSASMSASASRTAQDASADIDPPRNPGNWRAASDAAERRALSEDYTASYPPWLQRYLAGEDASARCACILQ